MIFKRTEESIFTLPNSIDIMLSQSHPSVRGKHVQIRNIFNSEKIFLRQAARNRVRVETLVLASSPWSKYAQYGARFSDLFR